MSDGKTHQSIAIIVEWENAILADDKVATEMLQRLAVESHSLDNVREVRFLYDPTVVDGAPFEALVMKILGDEKYSNRPVDIVFQPIEGLHYYEFKNAGARAATTDIVAFLDSDARADAGWLNELTAPLLADESCVAAAGATHIMPGNAVDAAFAAGWFFPLPADVKSKRSTRYFFANNVAFRRSFLLANPFPAMPDGATRGACTMLARQMAARNQKISYRPAARAWHPPPNGFNHFVARALAQGRDDAFNARYRNLPAKLAQVLVGLGRIMVVPLATAWRITVNHKHLRAGLTTPVTGAAIMLAYSALQFAGLMIAFTAPKVARNSWKI